MFRSRQLLATAVLVMLLPACGGGEGTGPEGGDGIHFNPPAEVTPDEPMDLESPAIDALGEEGPGREVEELPPIVETGCGDGICSGAETAESCAKDCLTTAETAAFVFAHKGDEFASLGRILDLTEGGAKVVVFYLTFDEVPVAQFYDNSTAKLAVASLGVKPESIYLYENHLEWGLPAGLHEVVDRLTQHLIAHQPQSVYLPQLCGGELEDELAHAIGIQATKRAKLFPTIYEVPVPSNYYVGTAPDPAKAFSDPDAFANQFIQRWRLVPKSTDELKPTLGTEEMVKLRMAAGHILNEWLQSFLYKLPEDRVLYLIREIQRFRQMPKGQKSDDKPYLESLVNPGSTFIYEEQGFTFDEYRQRARVAAAFWGTDLRTEPSAIPWFDEPHPLTIMHEYDVTLNLWSFSAEEDLFTFTVGFGPAKNLTQDCLLPEPLAVAPLTKTSVTFHCQAKQPVGAHTYYFRAYSAKAKENSDTALYTEIPLEVFISNF